MNLREAQQIRAGVKMGIQIAKGPFGPRLQLNLLALYGNLYAPLVVRAMKHAYATTVCPPAPRKVKARR